MKLINHIKNVHEKQRNYKCDTCNKAFAQKGGLKMHIRNIHEGERRFECKLCNKTFTQLVVLKSHEQSSIHNKNKMFKCESCQKKFTKKISLHSHEKRMHQTNNEKEFHCKYCNKRVKSIKMHIRAVHDLTKKVSCEICGYSSLKDVVKRHMEEVHEGQKRVQMSS